MEPSEAKRLKALEDENAKLKRLLAEAMLDRAIAAPLVQAQWRGPCSRICCQKNGNARRQARGRRSSRTGLRDERPIRSWQAKRDGERNEARDTFVYAHAALHGLISMGMRLNEEAESVAGRAAAVEPVPGKVIRSAWMA